ncbi:hypothetical protein RJ641_031747 [Dillenia turbinata]|uniref:Uncharacterized protein n=1 Tax=Dillenia turbinata TaxID=194707 RepID=A0AAN8VUZ1_9MAGN
MAAKMGCDAIDGWCVNVRGNGRAMMTDADADAGFVRSGRELSNGPKFLSQFRNLNNLRLYSSESEYDFDQNKEVDEINLKFAEARDDIEMALESRETIYFNEEAESARASVKEVLNMFEALLAKLNEKDRAALQRSMGLKIGQLKAELEQLND